MNTKTLITGLALTGALMAGTSAVKANAFLEVISGTTYTTVSVGAGNDNAASTASIGGWNLQYSINGTGSGGGGELDVALDAQTRGASPSHGLTIIYSSGDPYSLQGIWSFGSSEQNAQTVSSAASVYYSSTIYAPPSPAYNLGSLGTQLGTTITFGPTPTGNSQSEGPYGDPLNSYYITELLQIAGGASSLVVTTSEPTARGAVYHGGIDFQAVSVPDGGMTISLLGVAFLGIAGIRSKFARK